MAIWKRDVSDISRLRAVEKDTLSAHLGIEIIAVGEDTLTARMPIDHRTIQPHGRLHGGASVALAETVGSIAANLTLGANESIGVGLEINANHIRPVKSGWVIAMARPEALGKTTQVWSIKIVDEQDRLVCVSRFTVAVIAAAGA